METEKRTAEEICRDLKNHLEGIRRILSDIYGAKNPETDRYMYDVSVRDQAKKALYAFKTGFEINADIQWDELHTVLGLGPANWWSPCKHERKKDE